MEDYKVSDVASEEQKQRNINAFKEGVNSHAPTQGWQYSDKVKPQGISDVDYIGVEVKTTNGGMTVADQYMRVPGGNMTSVEIFADMAHINKEALIHDKIPGKSEDYYAEIGEHEAGHLHEYHGFMDGGVGNEVVGDKAAYNGNRPHVEEAIRDSRKIATLVNPSHATSLALPDQAGGREPQVNTMRIHAASRAFHDTVAADLISSGKIQSANELEAFHKEHPDSVRQSVETLNKSRAFDDISGTVGIYARQMVEDYLDTSAKYLKGKEDKPSFQFKDNANSLTSPSGEITGPQILQQQKPQASPSIAP